MRYLAITLACLSVSACSGDDADNTANVDPPPFDVEVPSNLNGETSAERTARLREKAKTDPEGADAEAIESMGQNEVLATAINSAGYLCARVVSAYPVGGNINVECVEYRSGKGRAKYRIDPNAGTVEPR